MEDLLDTEERKEHLGVFYAYKNNSGIYNNPEGKKEKKISFIKKRKKKQKVRSVFFLFFFSFKVDTPINEQWSLRKIFLNKGKKMKKLDC